MRISDWSSDVCSSDLLAIIDKRRPKANVATVMHIIGDVRGKICVLVDDIVDTAGTPCAAAAALKAEGATKVVAYCTHRVLSGAAIDKIGRASWRGRLGQLG